MNETNNDQNQKPKTSKLATAALLSILLPYFLFILSLCFIIPLYPSNSLEVYFMIPLSVALFGGLVASPILGIVALRRIKQSNGLLVGKGRAITAIAVSFVFILSAILMPQCGKARPLGPRFACKTNVNMLGTVIMSYAFSHNGNGHITMEAEKWCDFLITTANIEPKFLICRASDAIRGESSYALNKNVAGMTLDEIPDDVVLLFETTPGWNQVGGPKLLTVDNHKEVGCHVLFADGHAEFIKKEDLDTLRWEP